MDLPRFFILKILIFIPPAFKKMKVVIYLFSLLTLWMTWIEPSFGYLPRYQATSSLVSSTKVDQRGNLVERKPSTSTISLKASNKKNRKVEAKDETIQQKWNFSLFLVYMTPWRNPNSIFVYMFLILYCLGKYSESMSAAAK